MPTSDQRNPWLATPPKPGGEPELYGEPVTVRERLQTAFAAVLGYEGWRSNAISGQREQLGALADAAIHALQEVPPEHERAENGDYLPARRPLTAAERDVLAQTLGHVVYPWTKAGRAEVSAADRRELTRLLSLRTAQQLATLQTIIPVIDPRAERERA